MYEDIKEKDILYLDIETKYIMQDFEGGWKRAENYKKIGIAELGILQNGKYETFEETNILNLVYRLCDASNVKLIVGHNITQFDYEVLKHYFTKDVMDELKMKTFDTMLEFAKHTKDNAGWVSLDDIASRNFGMQKTENSIKIPEMWRNGETEKVKAYLLNDLLMTEKFFLAGKKGQNFKHDHKIYGKSQGEREIFVKWQFHKY